jgi:hypothetical protein
MPLWTCEQCGAQSPASRDLPRFDHRRSMTLRNSDNSTLELSSRIIYRRSEALEKRRKLMEAWVSYCEPQPLATLS